jgi:hypothetical protein
MADITLTGFLPEEWLELRALLDDLVPSGAGLLRWDEWRFEDGARMRSASIVRSASGPTVEDIGTRAIAKARERGFKVTSFEAPFQRTSLELGERLLRVWHKPLPRQVVVDLAEPPIRFDVSHVPPVEVMLRLTATAGAAKLLRVHRWAELDLEHQNRFFPPQTDLVVGGPYDKRAMCKALEEVGFHEEGDRWARESDRVRAEVKLLVDVEISLSPIRLPSRL